MKARQFEFQKKRLIWQLVKIFLLMIVGMTVYESIKQVVHPNISIWQSHIVTIIFSSVCATVAAFYFLRKQIRLNSQLNSKNFENERLSRELKKTVVQLEKALTRIKPLTRLLPICTACKKIRDDNGYWQQIESYIEEHADVDFSRSICPECAKNKYPDIFNSMPLI
jgi:hypothetical protein